MAEPLQLLLALECLQLWGWQRDWSGLRLLVTAGPTREPLDPARCITNPSSGRMGVLLAQAARLRGAEVTLVHGPLALDPQLLAGLCCEPVQTAAEMEQALLRLQPGFDAIAMAAAVADHRRQQPLDIKLSKHDLAAELSTGWQAVPDLLAGLVARRPAGQRILGFAAQSGDVLPAARAKWARKGCDLLFANPIDQAGAGFAVDTNQGWLLGGAGGGTGGGAGGEQQLLSASKLEIAQQLLTALRP
jgi:phosphopantothenoylcysteine decarboxylase/phosphopantothenate--cysteine ligase